MQEHVFVLAQRSYKVCEEFGDLLIHGLFVLLIFDTCAGSHFINKYQLSITSLHRMEISVTKPQVRDSNLKPLSIPASITPFVHFLTGKEYLALLVAKNLAPTIIIGFHSSNYRIDEIKPRKIWLKWHAGNLFRTYKIL